MELCTGNTVNLSAKEPLRNFWCSPDRWCVVFEVCLLGTVHTCIHLPVRLCTFTTWCTLAYLVYAGLYAHYPTRCTLACTLTTLHGVHWLVRSLPYTVYAGLYAHYPTRCTLACTHTTLPGVRWLVRTLPYTVYTGLYAHYPTRCTLACTHTTLPGVRWLVRSLPYPVYTGLYTHYPTRCTLACTHTTLPGVRWLVRTLHYPTWCTLACTHTTLPYLVYAGLYAHYPTRCTLACTHTTLPYPVYAGFCSACRGLEKRPIRSSSPVLIRQTQRVMLIPSQHVETNIRSACCNHMPNLGLTWTPSHISPVSHVAMPYTGPLIRTALYCPNYISPFISNQDSCFYPLTLLLSYSAAPLLHSGTPADTVDSPLV
ncbi:uncharacterized [Tachysurus ichikawai]